MAIENHDESGDRNELEGDEINSFSESENIADPVDIDDADEGFQEVLDFADEVFIDHFDILPPDEE
jgi:hypothetical protein